MALDPAKPIQQKKIPAGTVLFEAQSHAHMLCLLHQGEVTAFSRPDAAGKKKRLYPLPGNSSPGFGPLIRQEAYPFHLVTTKDSVVSAFPVHGNFPTLILSKLNVGMMSVRSLVQENIQAMTALKRLSALLAMLQKWNDNLAIAYFKCNPNAFNSSGGGNGEQFDPVIPAARMVVAEFKQNGGEIPEPLTQEWMQSDLSGLLRKNYEFDSEFNIDEFNFLRRILSLPPETQGNIYKTDINILAGLGERLAYMLDQAVNELLQLQDSIDEQMESLLSGEYCFAEKYSLLTDTVDSGGGGISMPEFIEILRFISAAGMSGLKNYSSLNGCNYEQGTQALEKLKKYVATHQADTPSVKQRSSAIRAGVDVTAIRKELAGSPGKIMNFVGIATEDTNKMIAHLKTFAKMQNPLDTSGDPRKLRRMITNIYWNVYEKAFFKHRDSRGNVPKPVRLMLDFGFFDDNLLQDDHLAALYNLSDPGLKGRIPIMNALEWIDSVANKKEYPSLDEMGLTFFDKLKHEHADKNWRRETDVPEEYDNYKSRIAYELKNFLVTNVRLTSGTPASAFPILTKYQIILPLEKCFVTFERLSNAIDQLLSIDYSAFHREILINDEKANIFKEFVQRQVIPYFILVPSIGTKIMMWQDVSGRNKASLGRIAIPRFVTADLFTVLLDAVGAFRWELTKTIMGPDWNNVSQPSITADYTDYVQFFRKNRDLSPEIKDKLKVEFKRFRSDRDRFVNDYVNWIKYESEGVLKHNKVARSLFYRHVPFAKSIRDNLENQPAYAELQNRFKNIRNKKLRELEIRYRKYGEILPPVLQENIDFYKV